MKYFWSVVAVLLAAAGAVSLKPSLLGDHALGTPFAQIIALRGVIAVAFIAAALFLGIFSIIRYKLVNRGRIAAALAVAWLAIGVAHGAVIFDRGTNNPGTFNGDRDPNAITLLTYNTLGGETRPQELADLVVKEGIDVIALPETSTQRGVELVAILKEHGLDFQQFDTSTSEYEAEFTSTVLLVSTELGEYKQLPGLHQTGSVVAEPLNGKGPQFIAVHPIAPQPGGIMEYWRAQITEVYGLCDGSRDRIILGDFNSTADHQALLNSSCTDAGNEAKVAGLGTWPIGLPALLASPIDRVLTDGGKWVGIDGALVQIGSSDHRGLMVRLAPASQG